MQKRVRETVFKLMDKMDAGLPVHGGQRTRKLVRLSLEQTKKLMEMPWPPARRHVLPDYMIDRIKDPKLREMQCAAKAERAALHRVRDKEIACMRDQFVNRGYADMAIEVDEDGGEWMVEL